MRSQMVSLLFCLVLLISAVGCTDTTQLVKDAQPTKVELLEEINNEHRSISREEIDPTPYLRTSISFEDYKKHAALYEKDVLKDSYRADKPLTVEQATDDVNYLFDAFYYTYALYDYFGGSTAYETARQAILEDLSGKDALTAEELQDILLTHLDFMKDGHFNINTWNTARTTKIPFFFRKRSFLKTENGYETSDGKTVSFVDNHGDLDDLFKRSISHDGYLVYYPVLLKNSKFKDAYNKKQFCDEKLTIHYTDGSSETLTAEPYQIYHKNLPNNAVSRTRKIGNIAELKLNSFKKGFKQMDLKKILLGANYLKSSPTAIYDLRSNGGGDESVVYDWLREYSGQRISGSGRRFNAYTGEPISSLRGHWIKNKNTLLVLCGKWSASGSEITLDCLYHLENCVIIGENTFGAMIGNNGGIELPNSKCIVHFTQRTVYVSAESSKKYFEEMGGFIPDIWVPAANAEDLAVKLWNNLQ